MTKVVINTYSSFEITLDYEDLCRLPADIQKVPKEYRDSIRMKFEVESEQYYGDYSPSYTVKQTLFYERPETPEEAAAEEAERKKRDDALQAHRLAQFEALKKEFGQ